MKSELRTVKSMQKVNAASIANIVQSLHRSGALLLSDDSTSRRRYLGQAGALAVPNANAKAAAMNPEPPVVSIQTEGSFKPKKPSDSPRSSARKPTKAVEIRRRHHGLSQDPE